MRDKFNKFMQGRYGVDELSRFTMGVALVLIILTMFVNIVNRSVGSVLDFLGIAAIVYAYFRIFSRNIQQRYAENQKYLQMTSKLRLRFNKEKNLMETEKNSSHLRLSGLWAEDPYSARQGKNRDRMSKMPYEICKEELTCLDM